MENTLEAKKPIEFDRGDLDNATLLKLYKAVLKPRLIEEKMFSLLRQGRISKWFSGYGQEAISVGTTLALQEDEYILPMHRNLGVFTSRNIELKQLFLQFQGKTNGFTKGRDRSFHFGSKKHNIVGMISHLGPQLGIADGIALGNLLREDPKVCAVFSGDGGASEGDFHEALNVAAVWQLPVLFCIENNQWGLSTPSNEQFRMEQFIDKGIGYGMEAVQINGNNLIEVYSVMKQLAESLRENPRPILVEFMTFRMRGHEEASGTKYYPEGLQDKWSPADPVDNFERYMLEENLITEVDNEAWKKEIKKEINEAFKAAEAEENITPNTEEEIEDVFREFTYVPEVAHGPKKEMRLIDAVHNALDCAMQRHDNLVLMGQDIAEYGGVFKATDGFVEKYGKGRVRNTPLCESAIVGAALGLSINGYKAMSEMQFADFVTCGFNQIVNNLAKLHYRWGENADVVVRMPTGAGVAAGPFHSQSNEAWFFHVPGLKIAYPSNPYDAKGLLLTAFEDPNPVLFFEHKALYRSIAEDVPEDYYNLPFGVARKVMEGPDATVVTYGMGVHWAQKMAELNPDISIDLIDLRTLAPLDMDTIYESVKKTGRVLVLHEDNLTGGIGAEIAARITEDCFEYLDAPVKRSGALDTPVPFNANLENNFLPNDRFRIALIDLLNY